MANPRRATFLDFTRRMPAASQPESDRLESDFLEHRSTQAARHQIHPAMRPWEGAEYVRSVEIPNGFGKVRPAWETSPSNSFLLVVASLSVQCAVLAWATGWGVISALVLTLTVLLNLFVWWTATARWQTEDRVISTGMYAVVPGLVLMAVAFNELSTEWSFAGP